MKKLIVIPARYKSSRLPGKPLKKILNKELILWVLETCQKLKNKSIGVIVATENNKIFDFLKKRRANVIMTSKNCLTGTDRVAEVSKKIKAKLYLNVQGDEPLINVKDIKKIINAKIGHPDKIICGYTDVKKNENVENKNIPKVIFNKKNELIYISRAVIPSSKNLKIKKTFYKQVCIYAFNQQELKKFYSKKKTPLEKEEDIEIIRFLEKGFKVKMIKLNSNNLAVDTAKDIKKIEKFLKKKRRISSFASYNNIKHKNKYIKNL